MYERKYSCTSLHLYLYISNLQFSIKPLNLQIRIHSGHGHTPQQSCSSTPGTHWNPDVVKEWITANLKRSLYYVHHSAVSSFLCVSCGLIQQLWKATVYSKGLSLVWAWDICCPKADKHCALASAHSSSEFHWIPRLLPEVSQGLETSMSKT